MSSLRSEFLTLASPFSIRDSFASDHPSRVTTCLPVRRARLRSRRNSSASRRWRKAELPKSDTRPAPSHSAASPACEMLWLIKSLGTAEPCGKAEGSNFRRNFTLNLRRRASLSFTRDEGQRRDPNDRWTGLSDSRPSLRPSTGRLRCNFCRIGTRARRCSRAAVALERRICQQTDTGAELIATPARHDAGPGGGAALAQLNPQVKGIQYARAYAHGLWCQRPNGPRSWFRPAGTHGAADTLRRR
jgi:hypothetical protein